MVTAYATVKSNGRVVIPLDIRRRFCINEGTRLAFLGQENRLIVQPITHQFIDGIKGMLAGRGLHDQVERDKDSDLR